MYNKPYVLYSYSSSYGNRFFRKNINDFSTTYQYFAHADKYNVVINVSYIIILEGTNT